MRETCEWRCVSESVLVFLKRVYDREVVCGASVGAAAYFVVGLNVKLDLLASEGAHSTGRCD